MSKRELIDAIIKFNRTASPEFLSRFAESDLKAYLDRVCLDTAGHMQQGVRAVMDRAQQLVVA